MKTLTEVNIYGEIIGNIWLPPVECTKEFDVKFTPDDKPFTRQWNGLRDAVLHITNDGDFQGCNVLWAEMKVTWKEGNRYIVQFAKLQNCKLLSDLIEQ